MNERMNERMREGSNLQSGVEAQTRVMQAATSHIMAQAVAEEGLKVIVLRKLSGPAAEDA